MDCVLVEAWRMVAAVGTAARLSVGRDGGRQARVIV